MKQRRTDQEEIKNALMRIFERWLDHELRAAVLDNSITPRRSVSISYERTSFTAMAVRYLENL